LGTLEQFTTVYYTKEVKAMVVQAVPYFAQADLLNWETYKELGLWGALFAIGMLLLVFSIAKGHIKIIACGPNEGGIRELFGITLWAGGSGPHLHVGGIFAFRKVSFAKRQLNVEDEAYHKMVEPYNIGIVYSYAMAVKVYVRRDKKSIKRRVYEAEDLNRNDAENDEAVRQVLSQLQRYARTAIEAGVDQYALEQWIKNKWEQLAAREATGQLPETSVEFEDERSTYGYSIATVDVTRFVLRPYSELARAILHAGNVDLASIVGATAFRRREDIPA
jgi:hypothetical protein